MELQDERPLITAILEDRAFLELMKANKISVYPAPHGAILIFPPFKIHYKYEVRGMAVSISGRGRTGCAANVPRSSELAIPCMCRMATIPYSERVRGAYHARDTHGRINDTAFDICLYITQIDVDGADVLHPHISIMGEKMCCDYGAAQYALQERRYSDFVVEMYGIFASWSRSHYVYDKRGRVVAEPERQEWYRGELTPYPEYEEKYGDTYECTQCGDNVHEDDAYWCTHCDQPFCDEHIRSDNFGVYYCEDCYGDIYTACDGCGDEVYHDEAYDVTSYDTQCDGSHSDETLCLNCHDDTWTWCQGCDSVLICSECYPNVTRCEKCLEDDNENTMDENLQQESIFKDQGDTASEPGIDSESRGEARPDQG